jgi:hypothetical protein
MHMTHERNYYYLCAAACISNESNFQERLSHTRDREMIQLLCIYTNARTKISQLQPPLEKSGNQVAGKQPSLIVLLRRGERERKKERS